MGKFIGLNDQEWAVVEPLIPYRWGIIQSGTQPLHPRKILNTLRWQILAMKLFPYIPHRRMGQYKLEPQVKILEKHRWKVERGISWLQRKYRRLVVRWERRMRYWEGFLGLGILLYNGVCVDKPRNRICKIASVMMGRINLVR